MNIFIFDLDDTLIHEFCSSSDNPYICDETVEVLDYLRKHGILVLSTHNEDALKILPKLHLESYFDHVECIFTYDYKYKQLKSIKDKYTSLYGKCTFYFFDDLEENLTTARKLDIKTIHVNYETGITMKDLFINLPFLVSRVYIFDIDVVKKLEEETLDVLKQLQSENVILTLVSLREFSFNNNIGEYFNHIHIEAYSSDSYLCHILSIQEKYGKCLYTFVGSKDNVEDVKQYVTSCVVVDGEIKLKDLIHVTQSI